METKKELQQKKLYDLDLHEEIEITTELSVIRVPGGWIYSELVCGTDEMSSTLVFVPYNNEFSPVLGTRSPNF